MEHGGGGGGGGGAAGGVGWGKECTVMLRFGVMFDAAFSKKVVIVNSPYWNRKELWVQS